MRQTYSLILLLFIARASLAQWQPVSVPTTANFRAISAAGKHVIWIGGSGGTFLRTTDGGKSWQTGSVAGAEQCDFRDVQAIDAQTAVLMSAGPAEAGQARLYRTSDGGRTWTLSYQSRQPGVFFDGLAFWDRRRGMVFSDPVEGHYVLLRTRNGGRSWHPVPAIEAPGVQPGEAAFAASGSSIMAKGRRNLWIGSGGVNGARVFRSTDGGRSWSVADSGFPADSSSGVFGLYFRSAREGIAVGGDHKNTRKPGANVALTHDGGKTWTVAPTDAMPGLKEAAGALPGRRWVVVGPSGTGFSSDGGRTWQSLDSEPFHALICLGNTCWAVGAKGRVFRRTF